MIQVLEYKIIYKQIIYYVKEDDYDKNNLRLLPEIKICLTVQIVVMM